MAIRLRGEKYQVDVCFQGKRLRTTHAAFDEAKNWEAYARATLKLGGRPTVPKKATGRPRKPSQTVTNLGELRDYVFRSFWKGTKGEATAETNSKDVVNRMGASTLVGGIKAGDIMDLKLSFEADGLAEATVNRKLAALSKMLDVAEQLEIIERKPRINWNREEMGRTRCLTDAEEDRLFAELRTEGFEEVETLCRFLVDTGLRVSEALRILWGDVQEDSVRIWVTKSGQPRTVPLTGRAKASLERMAHIPLGPFQEIKQARLTYCWDKVRAKMGLTHDSDFVPHALRHTFGTRLVMAGVSLVVIKNLMGHKSLRVTQRYLHMGDKENRGAIDKLEGLQRGE